MTVTQRCKEPGCNGAIVAGCCQACGAFFEDEPVPAPDPTPAPTMSMPASKSSRSANSKVSARPSSISAVVGTSASSAKRSRRTSYSLSTRRSLGGGLVHIEPQPDVDALKLVRPDLKIPEAQRICGNTNCHDDKGHPTLLHLDKGFCPKCRTRYNFIPLAPGTVISGQYEVKGPIAIGGCGFVYMGWDLNVERYVVIKGLINSLDPSAMANAVKEKRFLADLRDPNIVDIVNFVSHDGAQFIVMEFVNGVTLKDIRKQRGPLPVQEAISYILGIIPAFEFLHSKKIIYCDFKIDNAMIQKDRVRLIDLGGARRMDDADSDVFLTAGYCAPEAETNPSITSDLYTLGRTLAVLLRDFDFRGQHKHTLPSPQEEELFAEYESLYRFLLRATAPQPDDRFQSASEMADQLEGVLREIVALDSKTPKPAESGLFGVDVHVDGGQAGHLSLPTIKVNHADPARGLIESALVVNDPVHQKRLFENARQQFPQSIEASLRLAAVHTDLGEYDKAGGCLDVLAQEDPFDWRIVWLRGRMLLAQGQTKESCKYFDAVYSEIPGELAPKLGVAVASELAGDRDTALRLYDVVSQVDPGYTTAAFGLARCMAAANDRQGAVTAYNRIPPVSIAFVPAMMQQVRTLISATPAPPTKTDLASAAATLSAITADTYEHHRLEADLFQQAIDLLESGRRRPDASVNLLGQPMDDVNKLRARAEAALRKCARHAETAEEALACIDEANRVRPRTLF